MPRRPQHPRPEVIQPEDTSIKLIAGTRDVLFKVDADDYERLNRFNWQSHWNPHTESYYAKRDQVDSEGKRQRMPMSNDVLRVPRGVIVDHLYRDTADNRKSELRVATRSQNMHNGRVRRDNTSGYKGVSWHPPLSKWRSAICRNGETIHIGYFDTKDLARDAYLEESKKHYGEF